MKKDGSRVGDSVAATGSWAPGPGSAEAPASGGDLPAAAAGPERAPPELLPPELAPPELALAAPAASLP